MAVEKAGALSDVQLSIINTTIKNEEKAQELIDLFNMGEDKGEKGLLDDALLLGFNETELNELAGADKFFKGLLDGSLTIGDAEKAGGVEETATEADPIDETGDEDGVILSDDEVKALEDEISVLKGEIKDLDIKIKANQDKLAIKEPELTAKQDELRDAKDTYDREKRALDELQTTYNENKEEYDSIQEAITEATKNLEEDMRQKQQKAIYKALADYDEETDGDWNAYLNKKLEGVVESSALSSLIDNLSSKETGVLKTLGKLQIDIATQTAVVQAANTTMTTLQGEVNTLSDEVEGLKNAISADTTTKTNKEIELGKKTAKLEAARKTVTVETKTNPSAYTSATTPEGEDKLVEDKKLADLKDMLPEKELALVEELVEKGEVDLYEKLENGEPRYIFAPGAEDGIYHVYDMSGKLTEAGDNSLVRLHYGYTGESFDIIACGNGGITPGTWSKLGTCTQDGKQVFYADDCGTVKTYQACYKTWSPLSLDLNGDGVKTSDDVIEYDIDGDGVLDKINDSADGILVFDKDGDGVSGEDGSETFGDGTDLDGDGVKDGYKDGFEALKALAEREGLINNDDMKLDENDIKYLEENFGFSIKTEGYNSKAKSLLDLGITEINLARTDETNLEDNFDGNGNQLMTQEGATFVQNGETKEYADIWHRKLDDTEITKDKKTNAQEAFEQNVPINTEYDPNIWTDLLNAKLDKEAQKKADKNPFNVFDVNVDKPQKKDKNQIDSSEDVK